jgi:lysophospholipase L1-like esterase
VRCKVAVAAVAVTLVSVVGRLPASEAVESQKLYVAMGDSLTQGWGGSQAYPGRFFSSVQQSGHADVLRNIGVDGATSSSILGSQRTSALQLIDDASTDTAVVTVDIGGNDVLGSSCSGFSASFSLSGCQPVLQTFAGNFASLLTSLNTSLESDPGSERVLVMGIYNPASGRTGQDTAATNFDLSLLGTDHKIDCAGSAEARGLNDMIACVGAQHGALLADAYPPFVGKGDTWFVDQVHPNDLGHQAIADVFSQAYSNLLPVANAGTDQSVAPRAAFDLDAGGSSDPESGPLTYRWEQVAGPQAVIQSPQSARTRVTGVNGPATLTFRVTVTDPLGATDTDEVVVEVRAK